VADGKASMQIQVTDTNGHILFQKLFA
jgi:hypothetical protein